ncbi:MAG: deaminase [Erysipelothrix sp.]|nr:deaminase [Erysipelothrix sp.]
MVQLIYGANMSLDGYIEDEQGRFDWSVVDNETHGFWNEFQRSIGTYLYGRRIYETMVYWETSGASDNDSLLSKEFAKLWRAANKIVYSRTLQVPSSQSTIIKHDFDIEEVRRLKQSTNKNLSISGAELAGMAMKHGLVDECILLVNPIVLGAGKKAFYDGVHTQLTLLASYPLTNGVVVLHYQVENT